MKEKKKAKSFIGWKRIATLCCLSRQNNNLYRFRRLGSKRSLERERRSFSEDFFVRWGGASTLLSYFSLAMEGSLDFNVDISGSRLCVK
ncbi:hypothetical protein MANES_07G072328v8 [Manihot esculenta]|uniref:Uncharacterized protein n=1 Tax=Manihot esculenta TaxID=3983 RepID=A0ACB7HIZ8_MANES|nr:hypothetical protein MANES_07G072328v8 [Manihot esculenta]